MRATLDFGQLGLRLTPKQSRFVTTKTPNTALVGGFGSGKTMPFVLKALYLSLLHGKGYKGILISPTYKMFARVLLPVLRDEIMQNLYLTRGVTLWDASTWSKSELALRLPWGFTYYFGSADRGALRHRGMNLAVVGVDEAQMIPDFPAMVVSLTSRLRRARPRPNGRGTFAQFFIDATPEGLDAVYEKWCIPPADPTRRLIWERSHELIRISTIENPGASQEYIDSLLATLSEEQARAYVYGEHVNVGRGLAYYNFDARSNVRIEANYDPKLDLHISWDFNIAPMSMSVHQIVGKRMLRTIDEISLNNSNTPEVCREFIRRFGSQGVAHTKAIHIYGDASAKVGTNQYDEIEDWLRPAFRGEIKRHVPSANPKHSSRLKAVNGLLKNARGEVGWQINPKCITLINDLKLQRMDPKKPSTKNKRQVAASGHTVGHMADTADYVIDQRFPYRRKANVKDKSRSRLTQHLD